jgi:hypothetical protein
VFEFTIFDISKERTPLNFVFYKITHKYLGMGLDLFEYVAVCRLLHFFEYDFILYKNNVLLLISKSYYIFLKVN